MAVSSDAFEKERRAFISAPPSLLLAAFDNLEFQYTAHKEARARNVARSVESAGKTQKKGSGRKCVFNEACQTQLLGMISSCHTIQSKVISCCPEAPESGNQSR
eukprot:scaffold1621_cov150-Pinguiococcus_pyrenoidosus.AAC.13